MEVDQRNTCSRAFTRGWFTELGRRSISTKRQHEVVIKAELPDMKRENIGVTFDNNVLTLTGERTLESGTSQEKFQRMERFYGSFSRSFTLPSTVDAGRIAATYKDGVLTIRLPQREEARPKQITVGE